MTIKMQDMIAVNGFFENGKVELSEPVVGISHKSKVIITFLDAEIVFGEDLFWNLIDLLDWNSPNDSAIIEPLIQKLSSYPKESIVQFKEILSKKLYDLDTKEHAKHIGDHSFQENSSRFSPDIFLFTRALVVAKGRDFYTRVLNNPSLMPKNSDFEAILYAANEAYALKTGEELNYVPKFIPETFFNREGWGNEYDPLKAILGDK
jgi:hypothetical protein